MADTSVELDSGSGGSRVAVDSDGTAVHQYVKVEFGASGTQTHVAAASGQGLPIQGEAAHDAATTGNPVLIGAEFDDTTPDSVDEGDVGRLRISGNRNLYVTIRDAAGNERGLNVDSNGALGVTGTVDLGATDNAVLDAIAASAAVMDDWDESDRCKVNLIAGVAGLNAGAGAVDTGTPRVTLASDDPAVAVLGTIDADTGNIATAASAIQTAVEVLDDWDDGSDRCRVVGAAAENAAAAGNPVLVGGRYDTSARTLGNGDVGAPALNVIGEVMVANQSSYIMDGMVRCQIKRVSGVAAGGTPGTDSLIAAVSGKKFRILALFLKATSATANNVFLSTSTDTDVLGNTGNPIPLAVDADADNDSGFVLPWNPGGWTETSTADEALILNTSAAQDIIYAITYIEVD